MAKEKKTVPEIIAENTVEGKSILFEYVRAKNHRRVGLLVSTGKGTVGWSLCKKPARILIDEFNVTLDEDEMEEERDTYEVSNDTDVIETVVQKFRVTKGDKFDFEIALKKALKNEERGGVTSLDVPNSIKEHVEIMLDRSERYFKQ